MQNQIFGDEKWEVIVVDNNSNDETSFIAQEVWENKPINSVDFRIVKEPKPGQSYARVTGMEIAKFDIISFVDDDNLVPENWISYLTNTFKKQEVGILGCTANAVFESTPPVWFKENENAFATGNMYDIDFGEITEIGAVYGAGMTLRKEIFNKLEQAGWQPILSGRVGNSLSGSDDTELCKAAKLLGYRIFYTNEINIGHYILESRLTWDRLKRLTHGFGAADVFMLCYDIVYSEQKGKTSLVLQLRKLWWVNYLGKSISLLLRKYSIPKPQREIFKIRMKAFCETMLEKRAEFKAGFPYLRKIFIK